MSTWQGGKQLVYFLWFLWERVKKKQKPHRSLSLLFKATWRFLSSQSLLGIWGQREGESSRKMVGIKRARERTDIRDAGGKWISVWVRERGVGKPWNCSKPGDSAEHMAPTKASDSCKKTPFLPLPHSLALLPNLRPPTPPSYLSLSLFFFSRSVAHGAEKIVFITCQHLAALSYATQDSIKLSYTGMKLQNRPGTPQQNYFIFFFRTPKNTKKYVCLRLFFFFFDRHGDAGFDMMEKKTAKGHFGETVLHTCEGSEAAATSAQCELL